MPRPARPQSAGRLAAAAASAVAPLATTSAPTATTPCSLPTPGNAQAGPAEPADATTGLDRALAAQTARWTGGLSPISLALAATDWALHLASQPARATQMAMQAQQNIWQWWQDTLDHPQLPESQAEDHRFQHAAWHRWPLAAAVRAHLAAEAWWRDAANLDGMQPHHQDMVRVLARQWLDMLSPANAPALNPEVLDRTAATGGSQLVQGLLNAQDDWRRQHALAPLQLPEHAYEPGVDLAITPGRVVWRNDLIELIQYDPSTPQVQAEPVFIVPSWIMKYYILDLSPHNSMVRWLVAQGHTVFIVSWRNPDASDAMLDMSDYLHLGVFDALAAIARILPDQAVHAAGYCLGGTLLSIAAAAMARPQQVEGAKLLPQLASVSLLAAETDFSEPGEMGVLIDESQVRLLEAMMAERGYLTGRQMAGSFQFLHSRELIWSATLREIWLGERLRPNDLMAWNADVTRMPAAMHSEYLRRCYLHNELALSRYPVEGEPVALSDIRQPIFLVGTEKDHVSPWRSVYKLHQLTDTDVTFVLTNGGHNAGIVSEPGHPHRHHAVLTRTASDPYIPPQAWCAAAQRREGSWWPTWHEWLVAQGSGEKVAGRAVRAVKGLPAAPGDNVRVRYAD